MKKINKIFASILLILGTVIIIVAETIIIPESIINDPLRKAIVDNKLNNLINLYATLKGAEITFFRLFVYLISLWCIGFGTGVLISEYKNPSPN